MTILGEVHNKIHVKRALERIKPKTCFFSYSLYF